MINSKQLLMCVVFIGIIFLTMDVNAQNHFVGEKVTYDIKKMGVKVGTTVIEYQGLKDFEGIQTVLITVQISALNFKDNEEIYADPTTLYPIAVKRDLNIWGKKEVIVEYYDHTKGEVRVVKTANEEIEEASLQKKGPIDNLYCFIYRYRRQGQFVLNENIQMNLPTKDVVVSVQEKDVVKIDGQKKDSYRLQSESKEYQMWFGVDQMRIPLRIDGAVGIGKTAMIMSSYQPSSK